MQDHKVDARAAAQNFLIVHPEIWTSWVSAEIATRVRAALPN